MKEMVYQNKRNKLAEVLDRGEYVGYEYIVLSLGTHPCGYVCLTENNPFYEKDYDDIEIECHGGLTYSEPNVFFGEYSDKYKCIVKTSIKNKWVIGWDYAHYGDRYGNDTGKTWKTEDITHECKSVIAQIITQAFNQSRQKVIETFRNTITEQVQDMIYEDACDEGGSPRLIEDKDELHDWALNCYIDGKRIETDDTLYKTMVIVIDEVGEEMIDDINYFIDEECQSYYLDPAFSSASDYWGYILGR